MIPRYGQLAYTSFDQPGGAGGWQVKQTTGDLSAEETQRLTSGIRTAFRPVKPLPDYPTPQQLDAAERRLEYRRWASDAAGYWHTAAAGADSTGRPGNVFAHVILDRAPDSAPRLRPIQRWGSAAWLRPFGVAAVGRATLPADPPGAAAVVTKEAAIAFALDTSTWRVGTLLGLLDAVAAALAGGAPVVLGAVSVDSAAQWIGLVSFLMSPGTAAALNFSTFDRADQLGPAQHAIQHLAAVPIGDLATPPTGFVAIDETATLSLGELGGQPHCTAAGQAIEVTAWSVMAQEALLDPASALAVLDDIDRHAAQTRDEGLHPAWPLAVTIAADQAFAAAHPEAVTIIAAHSPAGVTAGSPAARLVDEARSALVGDTTADAWKAAEQNLPGPAGEHAELTYLCRAIGDDTWLDQLGPIPVGLRNFRGQPVPEALAAALGPALQRVSVTDDPQRLLKLIDLLLRAGVDDHRLTQALAERVAPQLADPHTGPALARRLPHRLGPETRIAAAAATLRCDNTAAVSDAVLDWFADGVSMPTPDELLGAQPGDATWTRAAVCGMRAERHPTGEADRFAELWWLAANGSPHRDELAASRIWDPAQLLAAGGATVNTAALLPTLLGAPDSESLSGLADDIMTANTDDLAVACAALRIVSPEAWVRRGYINTHQQAYASLWDTALAEIPAARIHDDCVLRLTVLAVLAIIAGQPRPARAGQLAADRAVATACAVEQIVALAGSEIITATQVLAANLLRAEAAEPGDAVDGVLAAAAATLTAGRQLSDDDQEEVVSMMMRMAGNTEGTRRYRKLVQTMLARRADPRPPLTAPPLTSPPAPMWRNH